MRGIMIKPPPIPASEPAVPAMEPMPKEMAAVVTGEAVFDEAEEADRMFCGSFRLAKLHLRRAFCRVKCLSRGRIVRSKTMDGFGWL